MPRNKRLVLGVSVRMREYEMLPNSLEVGKG